MTVLAVGAFARWLLPSTPPPPPAPPHLERLAREAPSDDAGAQVHLATEFLREAERSGDSRLHQRALLIARHALALDAERADAARLVLRALQATRQDGELLASAQRFAAQHPHDTFFLEAQGDAALALGWYEEAEAAYQRLMDRAPSIAATTRLAHLRRVQGDVQSALALLKPAIRGGRDSAEPLALAQALCELGDAQLPLGEVDIALEAYAFALSRDPRSDRAHIGRGHVLRMRGSHEDALAAYQLAHDARPRPETRAFLADALTHAGWVAEASAQYDWALQESRDSHPGFHAQLLLDLGRELPRAEALAREEYARRQDVFTEGLLAYALVLNGKVDEAHASITRALRLGTSDARLSYVAGLVAEARGEVRAARGHLSTALQAYPPLRPAQRERARALLGLGREEASARRPEPIHY